MKLWLIYTRATHSCSAEIQDLVIFYINVITETVHTKYLMSMWINRVIYLWFSILRRFMYCGILFMMKFYQNDNIVLYYLSFLWQGKIETFSTAVLLFFWK